MRYLLPRLFCPPGRLRRALLCAGLCAAAAPAAGRAEQPPRLGPVAFQPGVRIDWEAREVLVDARVVLRRGALEFFACWPGKEHESILRIEAHAAHVYMALGLLGVLPGHPPAPDPQTGEFGDPTGDLVDIGIRWIAEGRERSAEACDWLREVEYGRAPLPRPWVFSGSLRLPDGGLACELSGVGVALVDFPDSLISYSRRFPSRYGALWAEARSEAIPPEGTAACLVLRPAQPRRYDVRLDFRGDLYVGLAGQELSRYCTPVDLADLLRLAGRLGAGYSPVVVVDGALDADVRRVREMLRSVPQVRWQTSAAAARSR